MALVERGADTLPLRTQADLLGVSRRSLYDQPVPPSTEEVTVKHRIDTLYAVHPFYGSRKMTVSLNADMIVNKARQLAAQDVRQTVDQMILSEV